MLLVILLEKVAPVPIFTDKFQQTFTIYAVGFTTVAKFVTFFYNISGGWRESTQNLAFIAKYKSYSIIW